MAFLLDKVDSPEDLKQFSNQELNQLAKEIRDFIIQTVAITGGHLASNLGVVELTLALHYHLNSPQDKIIWDVGHQSYTHKILTGRKDRFSKIRQHHGLSGYPKYKESEHDIFETGHSSTSISAALGLALARDLKKLKNRIYAVIGDGAMTAGMAFEAMNHAGHLGTDFTVILNDNAMSISPNVGALSHYLSNIRTDPVVHKLKDDIEFILNRIPRIGSTVSKSIDRIKDGIKYTLLSGILFEEMGFTYIGPLDGHNVKELITNFNRADNLSGPVLIHVITQKGKGYHPAEKKPSKYHGVSPFKVESGEIIKTHQYPTYSQIFGQTLVKIGQEDKQVVGITAAMPEGTGLSYFADNFPERFYDVGIAEQHAVTLGTGLARGGMKPVIAIYSSFYQRAYDQVIHDACLQNLPVTFAIDRAGIVGSDGETHQGVFDISFLRPIPNLMIMAPKDENELQHMLYTAINYQGPAAIRYPRGEGYGVELDQKLTEIPPGQGEVLASGEDLLILAIGSMVNPAIEAARMLATSNIKVGVINARFVKPLAEEQLLEELKKYRYLLTVEEQALMGGFGSAVLEFINEHKLEDIKMSRLGLPDHFIAQGSQQEIKSIYKLNSQGIVDTVLAILNDRVEIEI